MSCNAKKESKTFFWVFQKWFKTFLGGSTNLQPYILSTYLQNDAPSLFQKNILLCLNSLKFIYSEKATKFCEISTLLLSNVVPVKSKVEILQNFVAFSDYIWNLKVRKSQKQIVVSSILPKNKWKNIPSSEIRA